MIDVPQVTRDDISALLTILLANNRIDDKVVNNIATHFTGRHPAEILQHILTEVVDYRTDLHETYNVLINFAMRAKVRLVQNDNAVVQLIPNCFVIGQPRSGTTSLHRFFEAHTDVYVPFVKEINYYSHLAKSVAGNTGLGLSDYASYFLGASKEMYRCDVSPFYLSEPGAALRIYRDVPTATIIAILRDPVSRLVSTFNKFFDQKPNAILSEWLEKGLDGFVRGSSRWDHDSGVTAFFGCFISNQLLEYKRYFGNKFKIVLYNDFAENHIQTLQEICDFLYIDRRVEVQYDIYKSRRREMLHRELDQKLRTFFSPEIDRIESIVGRDLSSWRTG